MLCISYYLYLLSISFIIQVFAINFLSKVSSKLLFFQFFIYYNKTNIVLMNLTPNRSHAFNLAIKLSQYCANTRTQLMNSKTGRLENIMDVENQDEDYNYKARHPFNNIFNKQKNNPVNPNDLINGKSYYLVGKSQVQAHQKKLTKKKNHILKRSSSLLSLSRISSAIKLNNQSYLTKNQVLEILNRDKDLTSLRQSQLLSLTGNKSKGSYVSEQSQNNKRLNKSKQKLQDYIHCWNEQKSKKTKFPSVIDHNNNFRRKVQYLQEKKIDQLKQNVNSDVWVKSLKTQKSTINFFDDLYVQKIFKRQNHGYKLRGRKKLATQISWIQEKDQNGYVFSLLNPHYIKNQQTLGIATSFVPQQVGINLPKYKDSLSQSAQVSRQASRQVSNVNLMGPYENNISLSLSGRNEQIVCKAKNIHTDRNYSLRKNDNSNASIFRLRNKSSLNQNN